MDNLIIFTLHTLIAVFVILPMFMIFLVMKTVQFSYYTVAHTVLGFEVARNRMTQEI